MDQYFDAGPRPAPLPFAVGGHGHPGGGGVGLAPRAGGHLPDGAYGSGAGHQPGHDVGAGYSGSYDHAPGGRTLPEPRSPRAWDQYPVEDDELPDRAGVPLDECPPVNGGWAALALVLFFPLGIPALAAALRVTSLWAQGRVAEAERASRTAGGLGKLVLLLTFVAVLGFLSTFAYLSWGAAEVVCACLPPKG